MFLKELQSNETVRFRVPGQVARAIEKVKAESELLEWKFSLNEEIARMIMKACRQAMTEIEAEKKRREKLNKESQKNSSGPEAKQHRLPIS